jgi:hypothetical protein
VSFPRAAGEPPWQLKGFEKVFLEAGHQVVVSMRLKPRDLSVWSVESHSWTLVKGEHSEWWWGAPLETIDLREPLLYLLTESLTFYLFYLKLLVVEGEEARSHTLTHRHPHPHLDCSAIARLPVWQHPLASRVTAQGSSCMPPSPFCWIVN